MILTAFHGFCMALADSVPGVSGGTIAFIFGFYERFIDALHDLFGGSREGRKNALCYLAKLGVGWAAGMAACVVLLSGLFEKNIYFMSSLFLGLTVSSIPFIVAQKADQGRMAHASGHSHSCRPDRAAHRNRGAGQRELFQHGAAPDGISVHIGRGGHNGDGAARYIGVVDTAHRRCLPSDDIGRQGPFGP